MLRFKREFRHQSDQTLGLLVEVQPFAIMELLEQAVVEAEAEAVLSIPVAPLIVVVVAH